MVSFHYFVKMALYVYMWHVQENIAIRPQSSRKYCYFFWGGVKIVSSKIMNDDPQLLSHIFKSKYLKIFRPTQNIKEKENLIENISKKGGFWVSDHLIFTLSGQSYGSKNYYILKI